MNALGPPSLPSTLPVDETLGALLGALDRVRLDYVAACSERSLSAWLADDGRTELERAQRALLEQIGAHVVDALRASPRRGTAPTPRAALTKPHVLTSINTAASVPSVSAPVEMATSTTNVAALDDADELWDPTIDVAEFSDLDASDDRDLLARQRADFEAAARALDEPLPWRETKVDVANGIVWGDVEDADATHDPGDPPEWHDEVPVEDAPSAEGDDDADAILASLDWDADHVDPPPEIVAEAIARQDAMDEAHVLLAREPSLAGSWDPPRAASSTPVEESATKAVVTASDVALRATRVADGEPAKMTQSRLRMLQDALSRGGLRDTAPQPPAITEASRHAEIVHDTLALLGDPPRDLTTNPDARGKELARLREAIYGCSVWGTLPAKANHALTATVAARLRALQALDPATVNPAHPVMGPLFGRLSSHSKTTKPGVVNGLTPAHGPVDGSWYNDAQRYANKARLAVGLPKANPQPEHRGTADDLMRRLESDMRDKRFDAGTVAERIEKILLAGASPKDTRLMNLATPWLAHLHGREKLKRLRREINRQLDAETHGEEATGWRLPEAWPWLDRTKGLRVLIVGGSTRNEAMARIRDAWGFGAIEWIETQANGLREIDAVEERMANGTVDLVIVLRAFNSHKVSTRLFRTSRGECGVVLADSHGAERIRAALERHFGGGR